MNSRQYSLLRQQQGASLFIALIILLLVTMLAVTSMRGVVLETRITGNLLEQKRLNSAAESALREAEKRIVRHKRPLDICLPNTSDIVCIKELAESYEADFTNATPYSGFDDNTALERDAYWYIRDTGIISSPDPECFLTGKNCVSYYEVSGQATIGNAIENCGADSLCIRSVVATLFD